jgi:hypothetical protein
MELKTIPIRYVGFPSTIYSDRYPGEGLKGLLFRNCDDSTRILSCIPDGQIEERYICEECNKERDKYKLLYEKTQIGICVVHNLPMRNVHTGILYTNIDSNTNSDTIIQWDGKGPNPEGPLSGTLIYLNPPDINNKEYTGTKYLRLEQEYFPNSNNNLDNKEYICDKCNEERDKYKNKI